MNRESCLYNSSSSFTCYIRNTNHIYIMCIAYIKHGLAEQGRVKNICKMKENSKFRPEEFPAVDKVKPRF